MLRYGCPPEASAGNFTPEGDAWTIGSVAHFLLTGASDKTRLPDRKIHWRQDLLNCGVSDEANDFVHKCLLQDPADRTPLEALLHHPWFFRDRVAQGPTVKSQDFLSVLPKCDPRNQFKRACFSVSLIVTVERM